MKKKIGILFGIIVLIIISLLTIFLVKNSKLRYKIIDGYNYEDDVIVSNFEEYKKLLLEDIDLKNIIDSPKYDENFFESKQLIIASVTTNSGSNKLGINKVEKNDNTINIYYSVKYPEGGIGTCDISGKMIVIEVKGKDINNIEYIYNIKE